MNILNVEHLRNSFRRHPTGRRVQLSPLLRLTWCAGRGELRQEKRRRETGFVHGEQVTQRPWTGLIFQDTDPPTVDQVLPVARLSHSFQVTHGTLSCRRPHDHDARRPTLEAQTVAAATVHRALDRDLHRQARAAPPRRPKRPGRIWAGKPSPKPEDHAEPSHTTSRDLTIWDGPWTKARFRKIDKPAFRVRRLRHNGASGRAGRPCIHRKAAVSAIVSSHPRSLTRAAVAAGAAVVLLSGCSGAGASGGAAPLPATDPTLADPQPSPTGASVKAPPVDEHATLRVNAGASACLDLPNVSAVIEWLPPLTSVEGGAVPLVSTLTAAMVCRYRASGGFVDVQYVEGPGQGDSCTGFFVGTSGAPPDSNGGYFMDKEGNHEQSDYGICGVDAQLHVTIYSYSSDVPRPDAAAMGSAAAALWEQRTALQEVASGPAVAP